MEIPKANNTLIDSLATAASIISPLEDYEASCFTMDLLYKPSMTKHVSNWKVFEGDERIINFLTNQENFKDMSIVLALCNLPKAVRQSQRQHQNHFESWIYPSKTQRGISLSDIALF
jgi:hypothetical protein